MRRLYLGPIPDGFDPSQDIASGPWCFLGREELFPEWEALPFASQAFASQKEFEEASCLTRAYAESRSFSLVPELNRLSGTGHGWPFWRLMTLPWLTSLVQTTYERQRRALDMVSRYGGEQLEVDILPPEFPFRCVDTEAFIDLTLAPLYNWWIFSRVIEGLAPPAWTLHHVDVQMPKRAQHRSADPIVRSGWRRLFNDRRCAYVYGFGHYDLTFFSLLLAAKGLFRRHAGQWMKPLPPCPRIDWLLDFDSLVHNSLPLALRDVSSLKTEDFSISPGAANLTGPDIYYTEWMKYRLAIKVDGGERLFCTQHGGSYGALRHMSFPLNVEYDHAAFFTWGWREHDGAAGRFVPLPSPWLSNLATAHREANDRLLFIGTAQTAFRARLDYMADYVDPLLEYRRSQREFFRALRKDVCDKAWFRPYFSYDTHFDDTKHILRIFPKLRILKGVLQEEILRCRLTVVDHLGTTFYLCMAADVPAIMYWNPKLLDVCPEAEPLFSGLRSVGILFNSPEEASEHVNAVWHDVDRWWRDPAVCQAKQEWKRTHSRTSRYWRLHWTLKLLQLG